MITTFLIVICIFPFCMALCFGIMDIFGVNTNGYIKILISCCLPTLIMSRLCSQDVIGIVLLISCGYTFFFLYGEWESSKKDRQKNDSRQSKFPQTHTVNNSSAGQTTTIVRQTAAAKDYVKNTSKSCNENAAISAASTVVPTAFQQPRPPVPNANSNTSRRAETVPYPNYIDYENCMYCHKPVTSATAHFLTNGMKLHKDCYNRCVGDDGVVEKDVIGKAHAFWPGYPPDWETRKAGVLREAGYRCQNCGRSGVLLDVHHITPLSAGGSNEFCNLRALCRDCHQDEHPDHDISGDFDNAPNQIRDTVYAALSRKRELYIVYEDKYHNVTERRIRPRRIIDRYGKKVLIAYCYLRCEDNREFRLERIQSARMV